VNKVVIFIILLAVAVSVGLLLTSATLPSDRKLDPTVVPIRVQLQWYDQAQFIGFYVAQEKGYYASENLDVQLVPGGFGIPPIRSVFSGEADIGIATGDRVLIRAAERGDILAFATVFPRSIACFISHVDQPVRRPADFKGKRVGVYPGFDSETILELILHKHSIPKDQVAIQPAGPLQGFKSRQIDVFPAYEINEPLKFQPGEIVIFRPEDHGVQFYSDTLFTTREFALANRDAIASFTRASIRGWNYAMQNPEEAIQIFSRYTAGSLNVDQVGTMAHQRRMLGLITNILQEQPASRRLLMDPKRWEAMAESMTSAGMLQSTSQSSLDDAFDYELARERP